MSDMTRAALFDLDGVLIDSEPLYTRFWAEIGREYGIPDPNFAITIKGTNLHKILTENFPDSEAQREIVDKLNAYEADMPYSFFPGAEEFVARLRSAGWRTVIVTSSAEDKMQSLYRRLPQLRTMMDAVVTGDMVSRSKPDPEGYLIGAKLAGVPVERCVVFEDSFQGLRAGMASGAKVVAMSTSNPPEALSALAHVVAATFGDIDMDTL